MEGFRELGEYINELEYDWTAQQAARNGASPLSTAGSSLFSPFESGNISRIFRQKKQEDFEEANFII
ncbi:MAG: hypothetical protein ACL7BU_14125 [Candidatus Phlomobacter fragariae]